MAPVAGGYQAGSFTVPAITGLFSVTGLTFNDSCQGVILFGSNQATEDTLVHDPHAGIFMGIMALDSSSVIQTQVESVIPGQAGFGGSRASGTQPILMQSSYGSLDYAASPVSFNTDGFTVNFTTVPATTRHIHYLAWGGWNSEAARGGGHTITTSPAFLPQSSAHTASIGDFAGNYNIAPLQGGWSFARWGLGSYPKSGLDYDAISLGVVNDNVQRWMRLYQGVGTFSIGINFGQVGPFLVEGNDLGYAVPPDSYFQGVGGSVGDSGVDAFWDGPSSTSRFTPGGTAGDTVTVTVGNNIFKPQAVFFMGANGWEGGPATENNGHALMFGVKTDDYEGCVMVNDQGAGGFASPATTGNALFQSRQRSWCSDADRGDFTGNGPGVNAGTTEFGASGQITFTTVEDTVPPYDICLIAYGPPRHFVPGIYRRTFKYG